MLHSEWLTRKRLIDPRLESLGWRRRRLGDGPYRVDEYPTDNGPADYALCVDGKTLGIVEAKKLSLGPQGVLVQAERYSRGASQNPLNYRGFHVPFLYSTNGEAIWFHDIRNPLNTSRKISGFHTPAALEEMLRRDTQAACA